MRRSLNGRAKALKAFEKKYPVILLGVSVAVTPQTLTLLSLVRSQYPLPRNIMFIVFYQVPSTKECEGVECVTLSEALAVSKSMRDNGNMFVTIASENPDCVSKPGVDEVKDVLNYDGWISRRKK